MGRTLLIQIEGLIHFLWFHCYSALMTYFHGWYGLNDLSNSGCLLPVFVILVSSILQWSFALFYFTTVVGYFEFVHRLFSCYSV